MPNTMRKQHSTSILSTTLLLFALLFVSTATSCRSLDQSQQALLKDKSYCNKQPTPSYTINEMPVPLHQLSIDTMLASCFSSQSLNIANAIGILDLLTKYAEMRHIDDKAHPLEKRMTTIEMHQQISQRINLASLEISAVASELNCEEERASQFAYYLKDQEGKTEKNLIISSIIIGAAGAIAGEAIANSGFNIGVSLVEASLGALMLINKRSVEFYHHDNALTDIWNNTNTSNYFPPSIWYYLTYVHPSNNEKSLSQLLVEKWQLFGQISKQKKNEKNQILYFGIGGKYSADELTNRADMLDQTESYVSLMKQDLRTLASEIETRHAGNGKR